MYAIAKKEEIDASPQLPISTGVQSLDQSRLPWSVPLDRSRLPRSAMMAVQVQSTDVFLCYQRLKVSCALCNDFQAATCRPRQTTERRLAPLYVEHMPSYLYSGGSGLSIDIHFVDIELSYDVLSPYLLCCQNISTTFIPTLPRSLMGAIRNT